MKDITIISRIVQPVSSHSKWSVLERVKYTVGFNWHPTPDKVESVVTGWYVTERYPTKYTVVEEQRWVTQEELSLLIKKYKEDKQLPDNIPDLIEPLLAKIKKVSGRTDKKELFTIGQDWINRYCKQTEQSKIFNKLT